MYLIHYSGNAFGLLCETFNKIKMPLSNEVQDIINKR